ncbi:hypothetical protein [Okeania sp.]|uniref:hypothetical protein n=1 Tax=Okeania sp. TaxID=3100323 RepID=UPI002B4B50F3|nr:hypothetical protein [Okeania sp.]MEB3339719.1 hypothetical protein [Okeania sp.]
MMTRPPKKKAFEMNYIKILDKFSFSFSLLNSSLLNSSFDKFRTILIMFLVMGVISCSQIEQTAIKLNLNVSRIEKIKSKGKIDNQVHLKGTVESIAPFIETGAYELKDNTGSIWILTKTNLPKIGTEITVKGKVHYQSIVVPEMGNQDVGDFYIQELERIEKSEL